MAGVCVCMCVYVCVRVCVCAKKGGNHCVPLVPKANELLPVSCSDLLEM